MEIAQLGSALLGHLPEATALEPVKLPLILNGVCSLSSANYFPNPFVLIKKTFLSLYTIYFTISCDFYNTKNVNIINCLVVQSVNVAHHQFYDLKEIDKDIIE